MSNCNRCQASITWPQPFVKGNKPLNPDGSPHFCKKGDDGFTGDVYSRKVEVTQFGDVKPNWKTLLEDEKTDDMRELQIGLETMRSLAYESSKQLHPSMDESSNTFGQIVNANLSHLINLAKVKAIRSKK